MFHRFITSRTVALSIAVGAAVAALSGSAGAVTATADPGRAPLVQSDPRVAPLTCRNYHVQIGYTGERITERDWYGLYDRRPNPDDWRDGLVGNAWQWASTANRYVTGATDGVFTAAYWTFDYDRDEYQLVATERLQPIDCDS
jgi:hypothetical protein